MKLGLCLTLLFLLSLGAGIAQAASTLYRFDNADQELRFQTLTRQLRCLVCQGESIADSNADLAKDLRSKIHDMILSGQSNRQIIRFMTDRYGDFILYKPPLVPRTYFLWAGPLLLLLFASTAMVYHVWGKRRDKVPVDLQLDERKRLRRLLDDSSRESKGRTG